MAIEYPSEGVPFDTRGESIFVRREPVLSPTESDNGNYGSEGNSPLSTSTIIDTRFYTQEEITELMAEIIYWLGIEEEQFEIRPKCILVNFACRISRVDFEKELKEAINLEIPPELARHIYQIENQGDYPPKELVILNKKAREFGISVTVGKGNNGLMLGGVDIKGERTFSRRKKTEAAEQRAVKKLYPCGKKITENIPLSQRQKKAAKSSS